MNTLTFDSALLPQGWADDVAVTVDDAGDIAGVETGVPAGHGERVAGCLLPGVPNLHCHAHQRAMAGLAERAGDGDDSFWTWREAMYRAVDRIRPHHLEAIAAQLYLEMLKAGYTCVAEFHYLHHDPGGHPYANVAEMSLKTLAAAREVGIGITCLPVLYAHGGFGARAPAPAQRRFVNGADRFLDILDALRAECRGDGNAATGIAPHSLRAVDRDLLAAVLDAADERGVGPVHVHIAEQIREVEECIAWSGQPPVAWLTAHFDVGARWCLVHATHMNESEVNAVAGSGAVVGLCPTTEANLGDGLFDAARYLAAGGRFGVGSDSNVSVSPVEELRWLEYGQRLTRHRRNLLAGGPRCSTGRNLLEQAAAGGARAVGRKVGRIETGYRADLVVLDPDHALTHGRRYDRLLDCWIFSGNAEVVRDVYVGGKAVVLDRVHAREKAIGARFRETLDELAE